MAHTKQTTHSKVAASLAKKGQPTLAQGLAMQKRKIANKKPKSKAQGIKECHHNLQALQNEDSDQEWLLSDKFASTKNLPNCCWDDYHSSNWFRKLPVNTGRISISSIQHSVLFKKPVKLTWCYCLKMHKFVPFMQRGRLLWRRTFGSWDKSEEKYIHLSFFWKRYVFDNKNVKKQKNQKIWKTQRTSLTHSHVDGK